MAAVRDCAERQKGVKNAGLNACFARGKSMTPLRLSVLGGFRLTDSAGQAVVIPVRKAMFLLAIVAAARDRQVSRDRLMSFLWGTRGETQAHASLRQALHALRRSLPAMSDALLAGREMVSLQHDRADVDLWRMRDAIGCLDREGMATAVDLYKGPFLDGIGAAEAALSDWLDETRREVENEVISLLKELMECQLAAGAAKEAVSAGRRLVQIDPLSEASHRLLIRALAIAGDRAAAAQQYADCRELLARELAVVPSDETEALFRSIARAESAAVRTDGGPSQVPQMPGSQQSEARALLSNAMPADVADLAAKEAVIGRQEIRYCTARDGIRIAYALSGAGLPIVKAANWMTHLQYEWESPIWRHWIDHLSAGNRLVRYDERGSGLSDWNVADFSFEAMVADLESVVDAAGIERFCLLGISQGCAIAVSYAVRHPQRLSHLVLYGGYVKGWRERGNPDEIKQREAMVSLIRLGWGKDNPAFRQIYTSLFVPGATQEQMNWFNELQRKTTSPENAARLAESFGTVDVSDLLDQVTTPTLVLHAQGDAVVPFEAGRAFATGIRGARFVPLDSGNHVLLAGEPAFGRFIDEIRQFIKEPREREPDEVDFVSRRLDFVQTVRAPEGRRAQAPLPAVAVLPLANLNGDPELEYFSNGLTEDLIAALARWRVFPVIARESTAAYRGPSVDTRLAGEELGTRYLLTGAVRKEGERIRVTVRLADTATGHQVWTGQYDRLLTDVFAVQDEITNRVAAIIVPELEHAEARTIAAKRTDNLIAWQCCVRGRALLDLYTCEGNARALAKFERAVALDPDYSDGWTGIAYSHLRDIDLGCSGDRQQAIGRAFAAARRAVSFDPASSTAHLCLGQAYVWAEQLDLALAETAQAVELNPNDAHARMAFGNRLDLAGRTEEGIAQLEHSLQLNPRDPNRFTYMGYLARANVRMGRYETALSWARKMVDLKPDYADAHYRLAICLAHLDQADDARRELDECERLQPGFLKKRVGWRPYPDPTANDQFFAGLRRLESGAPYR
jgi:TolB-like protein/DNA-binding SARP family transcriptional activator/pimeloyl-ACP methyl ester carboxylesterase